MRVLLLNPPYVDDFCRSARWATKSRGRVQRHPDWMLIATGVLEESGYEVTFIDGAALNLREDDVKKEFIDFKPELTVLHTTTPSIYNDIAYAKLAKELTGCKTVLIGPHVTAVPDNTFEIIGFDDVGEVELIDARQGNGYCLSRGAYEGERRQRQECL